MRCEFKACPSSAESGSKFCLAHGAKPPVVETTWAEPQVVMLSEIPSSSRFNEKAAKLVKKIRALQTGAGLKVEVRAYNSATLAVTKRYALAEALKIGVRICGDVAYLWKLSEAEIAKSEQKGARLKEGRTAKKAK